MKLLVGPISIDEAKEVIGTGVKILDVKNIQEGTYGAAQPRDIYDIVRRTLGLVHHNMYIDEPVYDDVGNMISARVRIYSDAASVGTDTNVIETYLITADGTECGQFNYWQQTVV